jgi:hypothetical protein
LAAWAITADGRKVLLHLAVGNKESEACWTEFLRNMLSRGLRTPLSVTSDGAPGLLNAIAQAFPRSLRIRCWYHTHEVGPVKRPLASRLVADPSRRTAAGVTVELPTGRTTVTPARTVACLLQEKARLSQRRCSRTHPFGTSTREASARPEMRAGPSQSKCRPSFRHSDTNGLTRRAERLAVTTRP